MSGFYVVGFTSKLSNTLMVYQLVSMFAANLTYCVLLPCDLPSPRKGVYTALVAVAAFQRHLFS